MRTILSYISDAKRKKSGREGGYRKVVVRMVNGKSAWLGSNGPHQGGKGQRGKEITSPPPGDRAQSQRPGN